MAKDNIKRDYSKNSAVHRELVVLDPPLEGDDVKEFQAAIAARLRARGISQDQVPVGQHGKFTHATWVAAVEAGYRLGLLSTTYLKTHKVDGNPRGVSTIGAQKVIRFPETRDGDQLYRAEKRSSHKGARYYKDLIKAKATKVTGQGGANAALAYARAQINTTESPYGSNWGPKISDWIRGAGHNSAVPWCGCFVNACVIKGGVPSGAGWIGYTPYIVSRARAGTAGWTWHSTGRPGDLALFDTPGGDPAVHVGTVEKSLGNGNYQTIEGNTSSGSSGSQANGGGVFRRQRSICGNFRIIGFARPPY